MGPGAAASGQGADWGPVGVLAEVRPSNGGLFGVTILPAEACFISLKMTPNRQERTLILSQPVYTCKPRADYGMLDANAYRAPMDSNLQLQAAAPGGEPCTIEQYASSVGGLMFLANCTCPSSDITLTGMMVRNTQLYQLDCPLHYRALCSDDPTPLHMCMRYDAWISPSNTANALVWALQRSDALR
jgi:hypothetical protein